MSQLLRRKPISELIPEGEHSLKRVLGAGDLIMLAIGAVIGAGIFGAIGTAAAGQVTAERRGGPVRRGTGAGVLVPAARRRLRAGGALLRGAGRDDSAGGQRVRLHLRDARRAGRVDHRLGPDPRYAVGNVAVAISWGDYFTTLLRGFGLNCRHWLTTGYRTALLSSSTRQSTGCCRPRRTSPACRFSSICRRSGS